MKRMEIVKLKRSISQQTCDYSNLENGITGSVSNNSLVSLEKKDDRNRLIVAGLVVVWYSSAILAITTSKATLNTISLPFTLCLTQFLTAWLVTGLILKISNKNYFPLQSSTTSLVTQIAVSYTLGFAFTNISFSIVKPSFAETVKSSEPLSSVLLGYYYLKEPTSSFTYLTLIPICFGVATACVNDNSFSWLGLLFAGLSNFCFSGRAVLAKRLFKLYPGTMDELSLFYHISYIGVYILLPLALLLEGRTMYASFFNSNNYIDNNSNSNSNSNSGIDSLLSNSINNSNSNVSRLQSWLLLSLCNGVAYTAYNLASFLVLARMDLITHAVLNTFRRVAIILFTAWFFAASLSYLNITGVGVAVLGILLFAYSKKSKSTPLTSLDSGKLRE